jgi:hypothetical protein
LFCCSRFENLGHKNPNNNIESPCIIDIAVVNGHSALVSMNVVQVLSVVTSGAIGVHQHPVTTAGSTGTAIMVGMGVVTLIVDTEIWPSTAAAPTHPVR